MFVIHVITHVSDGESIAKINGRAKKCSGIVGIVGPLEQKSTFAVCEV